MSSKRKRNAREAAIRRIQDTVTRIDTMHQAVTNPNNYLATLPEAKRHNFLEVATYMEQAPDAYAMLAAMTPEVVVNIMAGLAYPDLVNNPEQEMRLQAASHVRIWHIVNELDTPFDHWPVDINAMTDQEILDQIDADREAGLIPRPPKE